MTDAPVVAVPEKTNDGSARQTVSLSTPEQPKAAPAAPAKPDAPAAAAKPTPAEPAKDASKDAPKPAEPAKADNKQNGVPDKYEFKLTGDAEAWGKNGAIDVLSGAAKAAGLSQDQAQKLVDSMAPAYAQRQREAIKQTIDAWAEQAIADPEFGGSKLNDSLSRAKSVYLNNEYATPELRSLFSELGLDTHPEVLRLFYRVAKRVTPDKLVDGGDPDPAPKPRPDGDIYTDPAAAARVMYPKKKK